MPGLVLGCVVGHGPLAALIAREEAEDVVPGQPQPLPTHVYLRAGDNSWSIEAVFPRIRSVPQGAYAHDVREYSAQVSGGLLSDVEEQAAIWRGTRYSVIGLAVCWLYMERRWEWAGARIPWRFCSQLAVELLRLGGLAACGTLPATDCSPAHLEGWAAAALTAVH